jgi:hypothetical protein
MTWLPGTFVAALVVAVLAVTIGIIRHDPGRTIVLNALGSSLLLIGLGVAAEVSVQAFWAAAAASLGSVLFTMADQGRRTTRPAAAGTLADS